MKRYAIPLLALALALVFALAGCGGQPAPESQATPQEDSASTAAAPAEDDDAIHLSMPFVDPDTSPYVQGGQKIAELVEQATDGKVKIDVTGSDERGERALVEGAMDGTVDIATCANSVLTNYIPQMNILDQAYLWKNADEAHAAVDGTLGRLVRERAETLGLHVLGFEESGFRNTFSVKPIDSMDDFQGVTIRTMENKYHQAAFEAFGATPVPMAYDKVIPALESGEIDACENATANCLNSGYYETTKNVTNTQHAFVYIVLCMSDDAWNRIPADLRQPVLDAVQEGVEWERARLLDANEDATAKLKELGVSFHDIDVGQLQAAYREKAAESGFTFDEEWQAAVDEAIEAAESA